MSETQEQQVPMLAAQQSTQTSALVFEPTSIASMMKLADIMVTGKVTVPDHLKNTGDCLAVIMQAMQWGMNPYAVAQKTHLVSGKLGYEAQLVNAVVMASGAIRGAFHYDYKGEGEKLECRVGAVLRGDNQVTWGEWLCIASITTKNSPLWKTNPRQQLGYLQVKNWARAYAPGAILGVYTPDELEDIDNPPPARIKPDPKKDLLPEYPDDRFKASLKNARASIESGSKSPEDIITTLEAKWTVSAEQKEIIRAIKPKSEPAETETSQGEQS
jgi:hypothetical protein